MLDATPDAYPQEWVDGFRKKYEMWKEGNEAPLNGTSVKEWPALSPAQVQNFIALGLLTIEDVAAMTEEAMGRYGMGGREIREKAREWISRKELTANALKENEELKGLVAELKSRLESLEGDKPRKGKPKE